MPPRAVFLDFDGVIADTENVHVAAWQRTLSALGWEESDAHCMRSVEVDDRVFLAEVFARRKVQEGDIDGWVRRKQELTVAMLADSPRVYPGVPELIRTIARHARLGVITTTWRENVSVVLKAWDLSDAFETIVGKEDVRAVKPDPECYRVALQRLRLPAADAVAMEDSADGLASAGGAGVRVVAVGHRQPRGDWSASAHFLEDLSDLPRTLAALGLSG